MPFFDFMCDLHQYSQLMVAFMDRNTSNVSFYCRESKKDRRGYAPIELSIIINKERCYIRLPRKEKPEEFKTLVNSKKPNDLKAYLDLTRSRLNEIETDLIRSGYAITTYSLKEYFQHGGVKKYTVGDLFREYLGILKKRVDIDLTEKTYRKYELARDKFFQILGENMPVTSITNSVILDYMASLGNTYDQVTVVGYTQKIKTVVQFALDNDRMRINPFSTIHLRKGEKNVQYLTEDELERIRTFDTRNNSLNKVRDLFIFQASSGLSYTDMEKLSPSDFQQTTDGQYFIHDSRRKTGITYTAVILPEGVEILKKYNFKLPMISNQKMNLYLKTIQNLIGLQKPLYTHIARHTYATRCLNKGIRLEVVAKMLGHSTTKLTQHYAKLIQSSILAEVQEAFNKI